MRRNRYDIPDAWARLLPALVGAIFLASPLKSSSRAAEVEKGYAVAPDDGGRVEGGTDAGAGPRRTESTSDAQRLTSAEVLTIRINGYANLSGDYRVNADDTVSIPVIGRMDIKDKSARELEIEIAKRISTMTGTSGYASVEIAGYKSIVVSGLVARAGSYPWAPGQTVTHAEALAGDVFRGTPDDGAVVANAKHIESATSELKRVLTSLVRMRAERNGEDKLAVPEQLMWLAGPTEARELIAAEIGVLISDNADTRAKISSLEQAVATLQGEVRALDESKLSDLKERQRTIRASIERVRFRQNELTRLQQDRDSEILRLERDAQRLEIELDAARTAQRTFRHDSKHAARPRERSPTYTIVRQLNGQLTRISAQIFTELMPGDILVVEQPH